MSDLEKSIENSNSWSPEFLAWAEREPDEEGLEIDRDNTSWERGAKLFELPPEEET